MDLKILIAILRRRWYVAAPILALVVVIVLLSSSGPVYRMKANFLLISPSEGTTETSGNILLHQQAGIDSVASIGIVHMQSDSVRAEIQNAGFSTSYAFSIPRNSPFVNLDVSAKSSGVLIRSAQAISGLFIEAIATQQLRFGVDNANLVDAKLVGFDNIIIDYSAVRTYQVSGLGLGVVVSVLAAIAFEGFAFQRREREVPGAVPHETEQAIRDLDYDINPKPEPMRPSVDDNSVSTQRKGAAGRSGSDDADAIHHRSEADDT